MEQLNNTSEEIDKQGTLLGIFKIGEIGKTVGATLLAISTLLTPQGEARNHSGTSYKSHSNSNNLGNYAKQSASKAPVVALISDDLINEDNKCSIINAKISHALDAFPENSKEFYEQMVDIFNLSKENNFYQGMYKAANGAIWNTVLNKGQFVDYSELKVYIDFLESSALRENEIDTLMRYYDLVGDTEKSQYYANILINFVENYKVKPQDNNLMNNYEYALKIISIDTKYSNIIRVMETGDYTMYDIFEKNKDLYDFVFNSIKAEKEGYLYKHFVLSKKVKEIFMTKLKAYLKLNYGFIFDDFVIGHLDPRKFDDKGNKLSESLGVEINIK